MEDVKLDVEEEANHINSVNITPVSFIQEYAIKRSQFPRYDLVYNGFREVPFKFIYKLELDGYEVLGEGSSKKEAKQVTARKLIEKIIDNQQDLLENEFKEFTFKNIVSPFDKNIKENVIGELNNICMKIHISLPKFEEVREEGKDHAKLFTVNCRICNLCEEASHKTKQQAKHLAAKQMIRRLKNMDKNLITLHKNNNFMFDNNTEEEFIKVDNNARLNRDVTNYHLLFKETQFPNTKTLEELVQQYNFNGELKLEDPCNVLNKVVGECKMLISKKIINTERGYCCILSNTSVYPSISGMAINCTKALAEKDAAKNLLTNMCILYI